MPEKIVLLEELVVEMHFAAGSQLVTPTMIHAARVSGVPFRMIETPRTAKRARRCRR